MKIKDLEPGSYFAFAENVRSDLKNGAARILVFRLLHGGVFGATTLGISSPTDGGVAILSKEQLESEVILLVGI